MERHVGPPVDAFDRVLSAAVGRGEIEHHLDAAVVLNTMTGALQLLARLGLLTPEELVAHGVRLVLGAMVEPAVVGTDSDCADPGSG